MTVYDKNGAQSDGTGLTTDTLALSYGSGLGVPALITWYCDDIVVKSLNANAGQIQGILELNVTAENAGKAGTYYATITNTESKDYRSNDFTVVYDELPAEIGSIKISDDLTSAANIAYDKNDDKAVITMNMKKFYAGKYYLYESTLENYSTSNSTALLDTNNLTVGGIEMKTFDKMTEGNAIKYDDVNYDYIVYYAPNGETTVMWKTNAALTRGKSYKLVFDQKELKTDDIGATARKDVTPTEPAEVAYLTAPAGVELVTVTPGSPATARLIDEAGTTLSYIGDAKAGTTIANAGFTSFKIFGNDSATKTGATSQAAGVSVKAGVIETGDLGTKDYYYGELKTKAGVYGKDSITLESAFKASNVDIVKGIELAENATTPEQADVKLKGVVSAAKVYVVDTSDANYVAAGGFNPNDSSTYRGVVDVAAGQATASLDSIFTDEDFGDEFVAWIVPDDESVYARQSSDAFVLKHVAKSLDYDADGTAAALASPASGAAATPDEITLTGNRAIVVKDQFGGAISSAANFDAVTDVSATIAKVDGVADHHENYSTGKYSIAAGVLSLTMTEDPDTDLNDGFTATILGSTLTFKAKNALSNDRDDKALWEVNLGDNNVWKATPGAALSAGTVGAFEQALSIANATGKSGSVVTVTMTNDLVLNKDFTIGEYTKLDQDSYDLTVASKLTNKGELDVTDAGAVLTVTGSYIQDGGKFSGAVTALTGSTGKFYMDTAADIDRLDVVDVTGEVHATGTFTLGTWDTSTAVFFVDNGAKVTLTNGDDLFKSGLEVDGTLVATKTGANTTKLAAGKTLTVSTSASITGGVFTSTNGDTYYLTDGVSTVTITDGAAAAGDTVVDYTTRKAIETSLAKSDIASFTVDVESGVVYLKTN